MNNEQQHINPWADKLNNVSLPNEQDAWSSMQVKLNEQLPVAKNNRLRWLLLLLLLLLIGVCNCPDGLHISVNKDSKKDGTANLSDEAVDASDSVKINHQKPSLQNTNVAEDATNDDLNASGFTSQKDAVENAEPVFLKHTSEFVYKNAAGDNVISRTNGGKKENSAKDEQQFKNTAVVNNRNVADGSSAALIHGKRKGNNGGKSRNGTGEKAAINNSTPTENGKNDFLNRDQTDSINSGLVFSASTIINESPDLSNERKSMAKDAVVLVNQATDSVKIIPALKDSLAKKDTVSIDTASKKKKGKKQIENAKGWAVAVGFNQFFAINGQEYSTLNSDGVTGTWKDYLPVPQVRYHFTKRWYAQMEAQFNAPQYTQNLLARLLPADSFRAVYNSVTIKKLYYFNLPFSIHYSPFQNFYVGAGIQFSQMSNGVGLYEDRVYTGSGLDSTVTFSTKSFKSDSLYQQLNTTEWRYLVDMNYHYKRFIVGVRYNHALSKFINIQVSSSQLTQASNSSLQAYLRYTFWRSRKLKKAGIF